METSATGSGTAGPAPSKSPAKAPDGRPRASFATRLRALVRAIDRLYVVRLYRSKVNFVSSLPRSGRVLICPHCRTYLPLGKH